MFAVIKTGGKQYRVKPGDLIVVEKLDGDPGAELSFDQVLMVGEGDQVTVGAPTVSGALVRATLIETRKGEKIKVFKKIRRQGYRRTGGHRQMESVLRITGLEGAGKREKWDGQIDLTPRAELVARSRGLAVAASASAAALTPPRVHAEDVVLDPHPGPVHRGTVVEHADALVEDPDVTAAAAAARKTPAKKSAAKKTADAGALVEPPTSEVQEDAPQTRKPAAKKAPAKKAADKTAEAKAPAKKAAAKKTPAKPKK